MAIGERVAIAAAFVLFIGLAALPVVARTITVGPSGCQYTRIQAAIDTAQRGDTVFVEAGTYEEHIDFRDGITLQGAGWQYTKITCAGASNAVTARGIASGRMDGFSIEHSGSGNYCAVALYSSDLTIARCRVTTSQHSGICITKASNPTIEGNIVRGNSQYGIYIYGDAKGTIRGNEISENGRAGILVKDGASPLVTGNTLCGNADSGIHVLGSAKGTIQDNEIFENGLSGVSIKDEATPLVERNVVRDNAQCGIYVYGAAKGTIQDNEIYGNGHSGLCISGEANPLVEGNIVRINVRNGIYVYGDAEGTIRDNEINENGASGLCVKDAAKPLVESNAIAQNERFGITVFGSSEWTIRNNVIYESSLSGISITNSASVLVVGNTIRGNLESGVFIYGDAEGTIQSNEIYGNSNSGVTIAGNAEAIVEGNTIRENLQNGIYAHGSAQGTLRYNEIFENGGFGILVKDVADPSLEGNTVTSNAEGDVSVCGAAEPPRITAIRFAGLVPARTESVGTICFHDANADLVQARFVVLAGSLEGFTLDLTEAPHSEQVDGLAEGEFAFELRVNEPGSYRLQVTLVDAQGLESELVEFSFEAISPAPPAIARVVFPVSIATNQAQHGLVRFEDADGDVVQAQFEVLEGDPLAIEIQPGTSFDPEVHGEVDGSLRFTIVATMPQTVTLKLTLIDAAGLESEPYEFTFEVK